jgi:thiol-disulfide isomerase/thioredoxin
MSTPRLVLLLLIGLFCTARLAAEESAPRSSADEAWAQLVSDGVVDYKYPDNFRTMTGREQSDWIEALAYRIQTRGLEFIQTYPTDPRRWKMVQTMVGMSPRFIIGYGPKIDTDWRDVVSHEAAAAAWRAHLDGMIRQMRRATDVPENVLEWTLYGEVTRASAKAEMTVERGGKVDWEALIRDAEQFYGEFPQSRTGPSALRQALNTFGRHHTPKESRALFACYAEHPNAVVAEYARAGLKTFDLAMTPMELKFTAVDGREVDLAKLRGKVVLVDFWATWCGPCIEEIPNVKRVYAAYHDKGFEIVGITLENARLRPDDTPEQTAEKLAQARKKLTDFTAENGMPWPQSFDGKGGGADIPKQFAVSAIPTMFLLDQEGKLVTTNANGEKLEAEVKRLLGL